MIPNRIPSSAVRGFIFIMAVAVWGAAQTWDEPIQTDRPGMANPPSVVPAGRFQLESGLESYTVGGTVMRNLPTLLFRTGIQKDVEFRLGLAWQDLRDDGPPENRISGIAPAFIGIKWRLMDQRGFLPNAAVAVNLGLPGTGNSRFRTPHLAPAITLECDQDLSRAWNLNYNLGWSRAGDTLEDSAFWAVAFNLQASRALSLFIEPYGSIPRHGASITGVDGGAAFLLSPSAQVDVSAGVAGGPDRPNRFIAFGFSFVVR